MIKFITSIKQFWLALAALYFTQKQNNVPHAIICPQVSLLVEHNLSFIIELDEIWFEGKV